MATYFERGAKCAKQHSDSFDAVMEDKISLKSPHRLRMESVLIGISDQIYKGVILNSRRVRTPKKNMTDDQLLEKINGWMRELMDLNPLNRRM